MNRETLRQHRWFAPALGGTLAILSGLLLWGTPLGDSWVKASHDYLLHFGGNATDLTTRGGGLQRTPGWLEALVLVVTGGLLGAGMFLLRARVLFCGLAVAAGLVVWAGAVGVCGFTSHWFPWLLVVSGQIPCALAWALFALRPAPPSVARVEQNLTTPGHERVGGPFGEGAYGKVWLARNELDQWHALKVVYRAKFPTAEPFDREFGSINKYLPVSHQHGGLLHVHHVRSGEGFFYYVMELGDALAPGWEENPSAYQPRDLVNVCGQAEKHRLPVRDCVRIGVALAEALEFLHRHGLVHRDIKPSNVIFVNGRPKLADVGLIAKISDSGEQATHVFTREYRVPDEEPAGTVAADIYALGKLLYVIATGLHPRKGFPELRATLLETTGPDFATFHDIICRACHPEVAERFASAGELHAALREIVSG